MQRAAAGAICALAIAGAAPVFAAEPEAPAGAAPAQPCPTRAGDLPVQALYGRWLVRFVDETGEASMRLDAHPEYEGGVRGTIERGGAVAQLAGDIADDGLLTLDESQDGRTISAVWSAELQPSSCGRRFDGIRRDAGNDTARHVTLRKPDVAPR
ncbi:MAG: hypothetical protein EOO24_02820 [Comamonadaceae bacterium]|nr:MAG: hypothetical protein EOO24_02820 [Comamonadaceae bacterium]